MHVINAAAVTAAARTSSEIMWSWFLCRSEQQGYTNDDTISPAV